MAAVAMAVPPARAQLAPASITARASSEHPAAADTVSAVSTFPPATRESLSTSDAPPAQAATASREPRTLPREARFDRPRWVMLRSLLVPGWGQAHNHAWIKAAVVAAADGTLRWRLFRDERRLGDLNGQARARLTGLASAEAQLAAAQAEVVAAEASGDRARITAAREALVVANLARADASNSYNSAVAAYNVLLDRSINRRWFAAGVVAYALLDAYIDAHFRSFDVDFRFDPALPGEAKPAGVRLGFGWRF